MPTPKEKLSDLIAARKVIPVIGAGVSFATARVPGWKGLIENGLDFADARCSSNAKVEIDKVRELLNASELIDSASRVKTLLGGTNGAYKIWLSDFFNQYKEVYSTQLIKSIKLLLSPFIGTTNYDGLLSSVEVFSTPVRYDWSEAGRIANAIRENEEFVFHLHGIYNRIETVIFTTEDYEELRSYEPYVTLMNNLWNNYTFLFVGCSKDGVLDADFLITINYLKELFPESTQVHYLLLNNNDPIDKMAFLSRYNIEVISYGDKYDMLPDFIDGINPNLEKALDKYYNAAKQAMAQFEAAAIEFYVNPQGWKESESLAHLRHSVDDKNLFYLTKRERFEFQTSVLRRLIDIKLIEKQVELWNRYGHNDVNHLSNEIFVKAGIQSYEALKSLSKDIIKDIHFHKYAVIHPRWFDNGLEGFILTFRQMQDLKKEDVYQSYKSDRYFFENLKRIMTSFLGALNISSEQLYPKIENAYTAESLPEKILLIVSEKELSIRDLTTNRIIAVVKAEGAPFSDAELINFGDIVLVVGNTNGSSFYWNPLTDRTLNIFHESEKIVMFYDTSHQYSEGKIYSVINMDDEICKFVDFVNVEKLKIKRRSKVFNFDNGKKQIGCTNNFTSMSEAFLFQRNEKNQDEPLLCLNDIWEDVRKLPRIQQILNKFQLAENVEDIKKHNSFPFFSNTFIRKNIIGGKEYLTIRIAFATTQSSSDRTTVLLHYNTEDKTPKLKGYLILETGLSLTFDSFYKNDKNFMMIGFLKIGAINNLVETYEIIQIGELFTGVLINSYHKVDDDADDIFQVINLNDGTTVLNESGKRVILIDREIDKTTHYKISSDFLFSKIDAMIIERMSS